MTTDRRERIAAWLFIGCSVLSFCGAMWLCWSATTAFVREQARGVMRTEQHLGDAQLDTVQQQVLTLQKQIAKLEDQRGSDATDLKILQGQVQLLQQVLLPKMGVTK